MGQFGSKFVKSLVCVCNAFLAHQSRTGNEHLLVQVEQGKLRGKECRSVLQKKYCCFLGIPYAKPPIGELRFMPPQEKEPWQGEYDATYERSDCRQKDIILQVILGSEDCLYLNIYTPKPPCEITSPLPVMMFIHGGGFIVGSGSRKFYAGDYLMNHDVILVTINYRLHVLGFFNLGIPECPGNVGLKDQVCALKWIQKNIINFGGNPQNVTIFGESAGATSVHYLMISPLSQGLFAKAILQSGLALAEWAYVPNPIEIAFSIGRKAGYRGSDRWQLLQFMKKLNATKLVKLVDKELNEQQEITPLRTVLISPSVEFIKEGAFLSEPLEHLAKLINPVPCIWGVNDLEGLVLLKFNRKNIIKELRENFHLLLKNNFKIDPNLIPEKSAEVKQLYFGNKEISSNTGIEYSKLTTDTLFYRTYEAVAPLLKANTPLYMYKFRYHGRLNFILMLMKLSNIMLTLKSNLKGASHGDELFYLFYVGILPIYPGISGDDLQMIKNMTSMWVNFATTGNPSTEHIEWNQTKDEDLCYLDITNNPTMKKGKVCSENFEKLHSILDPIAEPL